MRPCRSKSRAPADGRSAAVYKSRGGRRRRRRRRRRRLARSHARLMAAAAAHRRTAFPTRRIMPIREAFDSAAMKLNEATIDDDARSSPPTVDCSVSHVMRKLASTPRSPALVRFIVEKRLCLTRSRVASFCSAPRTPVVSWTRRRSARNVAYCKRNRALAIVFDASACRRAAYKAEQPFRAVKSRNASNQRHNEHRAACAHAEARRRHR